MSGTEASKLTPEQIVNWRNVLVQTIGGYALIMPDEEIQAMCDRMNDLVEHELSFLTEVVDKTYGELLVSIRKLEQRLVELEKAESDAAQRREGEQDEQE